MKKGNKGYWLLVEKLEKWRALLRLQDLLLDSTCSLSWILDSEKNKKITKIKIKNGLIMKI